LYQGEFFEEALEQVKAAIKITEAKPIFIYYLSAILLALGKTKEGLIQLETALEASPKLLKKLIQLNPALLRHQMVVDVIARSKRGNKA
jgi:tetratricopeptide (TPR) repeat protein